MFEQQVEPAMDQDIHNTIAALYGLLAAGTVLLNTVVILTFCEVRALLIPSSLPILSLAIADVLLALATMPLGIAANVSRRWIFGTTGCNWYAFSHTVVGLSSILHHAIIALERCMTIYQPMKRHFSTRRMLKIIAFVWGFVSVWCFFPIIGWSSYVPEGSGAVCSIQWKSTDTFDAIFVMFTFVFFCFAPFCFLLACYTAIALNLRKMSKMAKVTWGKDSRITIDRVTVKKRAITHGALMVTAVLITWLPYASVAFRSMLSHQGNTSSLVYSITAMFAKTSTLVNPIICFFWYKRFREGTKKLWIRTIRRQQQGRRRGWCHTSIVWYTGQSVVFNNTGSCRSDNVLQAKNDLDNSYSSALIINNNNDNSS